jgi:HK97 family phage major capsid protein
VQGDIAFVDLTYYLVGDRQQMTAASSTDWKFGNDQTAYRIIQRVDGQPWIKNPITPKNGGNALSPFVELAAR